jgi:hypothetical protein
MSRIEEIKQLIIEEGLHLPNRQRDKVYRRFYLAHLLRKEKLMLREIGEIFNNTHATIIHSIESHKHWHRVRDEQYLNCTLDLRERFPIRITLRQEILKVNNMRELTDLKAKIKGCLY